MEHSESKRMDRQLEAIALAVAHADPGIIPEQILRAYVGGATVAQVLAPVDAVLPGRGSASGCPKRLGRHARLGLDRPPARGTSASGRTDSGDAGFTLLSAAPHPKRGDEPVVADAQ